jgi:hypothetical protein
MKRSSIAAFLLAACGGVQTSTVVIVDDGKGSGSAVVDHRDDQPADPTFAFRAGYTNPGGMWLPSQMALPQHVENFQKLGVTIPSTQLADPLAAPLSAIVSLGGCTGSLVSADGLVVTNHHCVQGGLLHNSGDGKPDLVENGFLAKTRADELSIGPTGRVMVAQAYRDVTKEMTDGLAGIADPIKRKEDSERRYKELVAACEKDRPGIKCSLSSLFRGGQYQLIEYLEIRDVRLAYVPHRAVGNYGGEIDNWQWPRHTGDWGFYRAYVGPDGKPADYSKDNVPYQPKAHLQVTAAGVRPSDFVMITGYPGMTERTTTASEVKHDVEWFYPYYIEYLQARYDLAKGFADEPMVDVPAVAEVPAKDGKPAIPAQPATKKKTDTSIKAGVSLQSIQNGLAKNQGVLEGLKKGDLLSRKDALDAQVKAWAAQAGNEKFKADIDKLEALLADERASARADFDRGVAFGGSRLLGAAIGFVRLAEERQKPDAERKPGYQERDMPTREAGQKALLRSYDRRLDTAVFRLALRRAMALPPEQRTWLIGMLGASTAKALTDEFIDKALARFYGATKLEDEKVRLDLLANATPASLKKSKDPFIQMALRILPVIKAEEQKTDARAGELLLVAPSYAEAMRQVLGGFLSPDANSTLRITYGTVKSFKPNSPAEADWPFTTGAQLAKKATGEEPFDAPKAQLDAIAAKQYGPYADEALGGELPIDFLSDLDITGGNSGSPVINGKGQLVGLAFDGTMAGVASDVVWNGETTRTISVDARYMLWMMDALDGADHLIKEMGLTPAID